MDLEKITSTGKEHDAEKRQAGEEITPECDLDNRVGFAEVLCQTVHDREQEHRARRGDHAGQHVFLVTATVVHSVSQNAPILSTAITTNPDLPATGSQSAPAR